MENKDILLEQIDRYLLGQLSKAESEQLMQSLNEHPEMKDELKIRQDMMKGIDAYVSRDLKKRLRGLQEEVKAEAIETAEAAPAILGVSKNLYRWLAAAAALAILIALAFWLTPSSTPSSTPSPEQVFAHYYQPYQDVFSIRNDNADQALLQANASYLRKEYTQALSLFQPLLQKEPKNSRLLLAIGICELETAQAQAALQRFQAIIQLEDIYLGDQAKWYAALASVKIKDYKMAKMYLQELTTNKEADHHLEAIELMQQLP
ncbi:MAG: tetratricopeptide repeat protein [Bacteroidota bacterium]